MQLMGLMASNDVCFFLYLLFPVSLFVHTNWNFVDVLISFVHCLPILFVETNVEECLDNMDELCG